MAISTVFIVATFRRYSQQFEQKLCLLPGDEWWRDRAHTAAEQNVLSAPPLPLSLSPVCALRSAECVCALHGSSGCCRGRECAGPSPTRMGETAPRRCKQQDHRPIAFSGKRWSAGVALVPSPVQCPHTCRPGFLAAGEVLGFECRFCQTAVGCLCGLETGAPVVWRVDGRPVGPHTAFTGSQESHITRPAVAGGRRGGVGRPQNADRSVPSARHQLPLWPEWVGLGN